MRFLSCFSLEKRVLVSDLITSVAKGSKMLSVIDNFIFCVDNFKSNWQNVKIRNFKLY